MRAEYNDDVGDRSLIELKKLNIGGLAAVAQLLGERRLQLSPKDESDCEYERRCLAVELRLRSGETLVFAADRWRLSYGVDVDGGGDKGGNDDDWLSVSFVAEFEWQY